MAGVGFKLNKIFEKKTMTAGVLGTLSSPLTMMGPTFFFLIVLFAVNKLMGVWQASEAQIVFFTTSFTNISLSAILLSAFISPILSRYVSDKVFEEKEPDIGASMYGILLVGSGAAAVVASVLCLLVRKQVENSWLFSVGYFLVAVLMVNLFNLVIYFSVIRKYRQVVISYFAGAIVFIAVAYIYCRLYHGDVGVGIYLAMACGLLVSDFLLICFGLRAFGTTGKKYFDFLKYIVRYIYLACSGVALFLGVFIIVPLASKNDLTLFMAIFINMPGMVFFEIAMKRSFYGKYVKYLSAIHNGSLALIDKEKENLQNGIRLLLFLVYGIQMSIMLIGCAGINGYVLRVGLETENVEEFVILTIGMFFVFCMYEIMLILYYFSGYKEIALLSAVFAIVTVVTAIVCGRMGLDYYLWPLPVGGIGGWITSLIILRSRAKDINAFMLCK